MNLLSSILNESFSDLFFVPTPLFIKTLACIVGECGFVLFGYKKKTISVADNAMNAIAISLRPHKKFREIHNKFEIDTVV